MPKKIINLSKSQMAENKNTSTLRVQIEYYLSDTNLVSDEFFHSKILENSEGYIDVSLFLNCNKIKKLNSTKEDLVEAIKTSTEVELNSSGDKVRRLANKSLPELKLLKKKQKRNDTDGEQENLSDDEKAENPSFDPIIFEIKSSNDTDIRWKNIQEEFASLNPHLTVAYMRFKTNSGHIGVYNKSADSELKFNSKFMIEGEEFTVTKAEGDNLINFWRDHGSHFELCTGKLKKPSKGGKFQKDTNYLKKSVTIGNEVFSDISKIKTRARTIMHSNKDGEKIQSPDHEFLLDLLKYHRNVSEKSKNLDHFTTDKPNDFLYSRCFFIVKNDQSRDDFSVHKCIERIKYADSKKKK